MNERELEIKKLQYGTIKKKADLLKRTGISPNKLRHAVKKFELPIPSLLINSEEYALDLFDFLLDLDEEYYSQYPENALREDVCDYILGEVWLVKHKSRTIENDTCMAAMDVRKCLKDSCANMAQIVGRTMKNLAEGIPAPEQRVLREMFIEAAEEAKQIAFSHIVDDVSVISKQLSIED